MPKDALIMGPNEINFIQNFLNHKKLRKNDKFLSYQQRRMDNNNVLVIKDIPRTYRKETPMKLMKLERTNGRVRKFSGN